jgi:hypothetical protein
MNRLIYIFAAVLILASCSASKETASQRQENKIAAQELIKQAVESRHYVIKLEKLYPPSGRYVDLVPKSNFIIINGEMASVCLGYIGDSMGFRPISAINFNGHTVKYHYRNNTDKGLYNIDMTISKGNNSFDFYVTINNSGSCSLSIVNAYIQSVTYRGYVVPIPPNGEVDVADPKLI